MIPGQYPLLNGSAMGSDLSYMFVYANSITGNMFVLFMVMAFFLITLIGGMFMQMRFQGRIKFEVHFAAASFVTLGFVVILSMVTGLISGLYILPFIGLSIVSVLWLLLSES
jgi:hypothetical protein